MSVFPDVVRVRVINGNTGQPIPNIVVSLKLFARRKNDYNFLLPLTDDTGCTEITKEWIIEKIKRTGNLFVMDYSSNLEDCQQRFKFSVLDEGAVKRAVRAQNLYKEALNIGQEYIDKLARVDNYKYKSVSSMIELHGDKLLEVELQVKEAK